MAIDNDLEIIPVINKVDLDSAKPDEVEDQIVDLLGCDPSEVIRASGKTGIGVPDILRAIVERVPAPSGRSASSVQALIFDSVFNPFRYHCLFQDCQRHDPVERFREIRGYRQAV